MQKINIKKAIREAISDSGRQYKDVAMSIGITPQNLSNVLADSKREVPDAMLKAIAIELDDRDFKLVAAAYTYEIDFVLSGWKSIPIPIAIKADVDEEQDEREQLDRQARSILKKDPSWWSDEELKFIGRYRRELNEEVSIEQKYLDAIDNSIKKRREQVKSWT